MYRPRLLRSALRSGLVHAVVAVTPEDEIVGHIALSWERAGDLVPEGGKLVMDPRYRGHDLAERLAEERAAVAAELGNTAQGRHSLLAMWTPVAGIAAATVHVPGRHVTLLDQHAQRAGVERKVLTATGPAGGPAPASPIGCATTRLNGTASAVGRAPSVRDETGREVVGTGRFELPTPCSQSRCATKLRHVPYEAHYRPRPGPLRPRSESDARWRSPAGDPLR